MGFLSAAAGIGVGLWSRVARATRIRPPGAAPEDEFRRRCIRCFRCAEVCPTLAIRLGPALALDGAELPYLEVDQRPCVLCAKCTQVCPTGALEPLPASIPELQAKVRMGTPALDRTRCFPWRGDGVCRLCFDVCPYPGSAVVLVGVHQGPLFEPAKCVGCGLCAEACPSLARAIRILPPGGPA